MQTHLEHRIVVTESLELDLDREQWLCRRCGHELGSARQNYKYGCLIADRGARRRSEWAMPDTAVAGRLLEFYCPACAAQMETEYLAPGRPFASDEDLDFDRLKERWRRGELSASLRRQAVQ